MPKEIKAEDFSMHQILVIDDEAAHIALIRMVIEKFIKANVVTANNPAEGIKIIEDLKPDLVLLDIRMPVMDGLAALKIIRDTDSISDTKVIVCTTLSNRELLENLVHLNISGFIVKPSDPKTIANKISNVLKTIRK